MRLYEILCCVGVLTSGLMPDKGGEESGGNKICVLVSSVI